MAPTISLGDILLGQPSGSGSSGPLVEADRLLKRITKRDDNPDPSSGVLDPHDINNVGFFFLFALIGVAFVLTGIWFFFWARNGGFYFKDDDWDDYKSTVLRRKGPNGTILSNVTKSTKLGGGSVYKGYDEDGSQTVITESTGLSGITAGPSDIYARERREEKRRKKEAERKKRRGGEKKTKKAGNEGVLDETAEMEAREQLRNYRHERAARVGGLNKETEGSDWDGSTNHAESTISSGLLSSHNKEAEAAASSAASAAAPPPSSSKNPRSGGIRKVYSVADRTTARENEKMRAEARKLREEARRAKRDSNYERALLAPSDEQLNQSLLSGSGQGGESSLGSSMLSEESGAKSYHHPLPELKEYRRREREERRARRGGYLRGNTRDEELEEEVD